MNDNDAIAVLTDIRERAIIRKIAAENSTTYSQMEKAAATMAADRDIDALNGGIAAIRTCQELQSQLASPNLTVVQ